MSVGVGRRPAQAGQLGARILCPAVRADLLEDGSGLFERVARRRPLPGSPLGATQTQQGAGVVEAQAGVAVPVRCLREHGSSVLVVAAARATYASAAPPGRR